MDPYLHIDGQLAQFYINFNDSNIMQFNGDIGWIFWDRMYVEQVFFWSANHWS